MIRAWLAEAGAGSLLRSLGARPAMLGILEWPYVCRHWPVGRRFLAIQRHHAAIDQIPALDIPVGEGRVLLDLTSRVPGLRAILERPEWFLREGELTLSLFIDSTRVYSIAFLFGAEHGRRLAYVGAIQGRDIDGVTDVYRRLTRALHGVRPRDFIIALLQGVARAGDCRSLLCVSDSARIHRHGYFGSKAGRAVSSDYDVVWRDRSGVRGGGGFFELPVQPPVRDMRALPRHKRSMYRRRYAMYDELEVALSTLGAVQELPDFDTRSAL